jgi:LacI family transcriptional regulator
VVNQSGYVASSVREKVLKAVKELGYQPSSIARGLRTSSTRSVGVLVPQLAHPFFGAIAIAAEKHLFAHGYRIFLCSSEENPDKESAYVDMLLSQRVDGVILVSTGTSEPNAKRLLDANVPMVLVDRDLPQVEVDRVLADNYKGAEDLVHYLATLGHRRIAWSGERPALSSFKDGIAKAGLELDPKLRDGHRKRISRWRSPPPSQAFKTCPPPTAIMAENDLVA